MDMIESEKRKHSKKGFSTRMLLGIIVAIAIGLLPVAFFGWQGIISTVFITLAGVLFCYSQYGLSFGSVLLLVIGQLLYPVIDPARVGILGAECENNLRTLTIAIHAYESDHGHIPPPFTLDENGRRLHSWRVLLLPYIGENELYQKIDLTKPWDHPTNQPYHDQMPEIFCCSAVKYYSRWMTTGNTTNYIVVVGECTPWRTKNQPSLNTIGQSDGTSSTIAIIESEAHRLNWMSPNDPEYSRFVETIKFNTIHALPNYSTFDGATRQFLKDSPQANPYWLEYLTLENQ